jgi:hypothetical protein
MRPFYDMKKFGRSLIAFPEIPPLLLCYLLIAIQFALPDLAAAGKSIRHVLLLTSYHQGDRWNDSVVQGVRETLDAVDSISLSVENLDMRRYTTDLKYSRIITETT